MIYSFLGLSVGAIIHGIDDTERKKAEQMLAHINTLDEQRPAPTCMPPVVVVQTHAAWSRLPQAV